MRPEDRIDRWIDDLTEALDLADELVARGRDAYDADPAMSLAFQTLAIRVGEIAKRLVAADPERFSSPEWSLAARQRDFVVHHYHRVDDDALWETVSDHLPKLRGRL
ncbi:MAG: hypothetical protein K0S37_1935 [Microbacterium sp.]|jgi:uncharacterized protein with HEPN domain|nr:hypothetical protein [Microbacterium sp.]